MRTRAAKRSGRPWRGPCAASEKRRPRDCTLRDRHSQHAAKSSGILRSKIITARPSRSFLSLADRSSPLPLSRNSLVGKERPQRNGGVLCTDGTTGWHLLMLKRTNLGSALHSLAGEVVSVERGAGARAGPRLTGREHQESNSRTTQTQSLIGQGWQTFQCIAALVLHSSVGQATPGQLGSRKRRFHVREGRACSSWCRRSSRGAGMPQSHLPRIKPWQARSFNSVVVALSQACRAS